MTTATLKTIGKPSEPWGDNRLIFITLGFEDRELAGLATNEQGLAPRLRELEERLNKPAEWEFGTNKAGKATVKIPKAEGQAWQGGSKGGGGKWQPRSVEERAEIMSMNMLSAATSLCSNEWSAIRFDRAVEMVQDGMSSLLGYTRGALQDVGASRGSSEAAVDEHLPNSERSLDRNQPAGAASTNTSDGDADDAAAQGSPVPLSGTDPETAAPTAHRYIGDGDGPCVFQIAPNTSCGWLREGHEGQGKLT